MDVISVITKLSENPTPSGFEHSALRKISSLMSRFLTNVTADSFGNVYGFRKCGKKNAKCLLLDAHIDEIGLIVTGEKDGFLTFRALGGVDPRILPATNVTVLSDPPVKGVITATPPHLQTADEKDNAIDIDSLYIDIGAEENDKKISVGTPVIFDSGVVKLRENYISARALDDRASLAAILYAIDMLKGKKLNFDIVVQASAEEELGCRGASVGGYTQNPDWAVVVDVTHAITPGVDKSVAFEAGSGVAVGVGPNMTRKMSDTLLKVAKEKKIPHTVEVCPGHSGTNAWPMQIVREGVATGLLSIPLKYMHTPVETVKKKDIEATGKLIYEFALSLAAGGAKL